MTCSGMKLFFSTATEADAPVVTALRAAVAADLTRRYGHGHWSSVATENGVLRDINTAHVLIARSSERAVGTVRLATSKPWAIDPEYFTPCASVLYLTDMAVAPDLQRQGIGRLCLEHAIQIARGHPANAIRLDAYDGPVGAGQFYAKCGFREVGRVTYRKTPLIYYELLLGF
jgi:GNAT superfamily N-acetyltransferase